MPRLFKLLFSLALAGSSGLGLAAWLLWQWSGKPKTTGEEAHIVQFGKGTRLAELAANLDREGLVDHALLFQLWVRFFSDYSRFQAGDYRFEGQISPRQIAAVISTGDTYTPLVAQFTIPEGFTLRQTIDRLVAHEIGDKANLTKLAHDQDFLRSLRVDARNLEGFLYPATYSYTKKPDGLGVFKDMVGTFWQRLPQGFEAGVKTKGLNLYQGIVFASLIEAETVYDDERAKISEVIWQRLKNGEPIAIDAAIIYGIKDYKGDITWKHLKDGKNPYNTRIHKGLPPSPIGSPSDASLAAVLNPTNEGFYYYVLKNDGSNRHHFSKTLSEHNRHVKLLLESSRAAGR